MLAAVVAGILLSYYELLPVLGTLLVASVFSALLLIFGGFFPRLREVLWGTAVLLLLLAFSMWNCVRAFQKSDWYGLSQEPRWLSVQVLQAPVERQKSWQVQVALDGDKEAVLYLQKDSTLRLPVLGDSLLVRTAISRPLPADEYSFDYGHYLELQGIVGSGVVLRGRMVITGHSDLHGLMPLMRRLRDRIELLFAPFAMRERGVLEALLLGDRRHLSADTRNAFAVSGAMHVLAVSGLHVGIIAWLLMWVLTLAGRYKPLYEDRWQRYLQAGLVCLALVFYALLTGLSPSVCRSVLMFILLVTGQLIRPLRSRYNDVAASAFLILTVSPLSLLKSGFLLSFSAVLAILRFYPSLQIPGKNKFVRSVWDLIAISLCAQLGTLPWTIAFFHRVSNYFILTNLGVLPIVQFLLIPTFFVFLLLAPIPLVGPFVGRILEGETWLLNEYVAWIEHLPGSSFELWLSPWCLVTVLAIVFCFMLRGRRRWWAVAVLTVAFIVLLAQDYRAASRETDMRVYQRGKNTVVMAREGRTALLMGNDSTYSYDATHDYRLARHVRQTRFSYVQDP